MIPLRDANPSSRFPVVTLALIALCTAAYLYEVSLGPGMQAFVGAYGLVPGEVTYGIQSRQIDVFGLLRPFVTSMFLHGGWLHLIGNMWFLWIFGDNVEDTLGAPRFLIFYLLSGLGAGAAHYLLQPSSAVPTIGASGAIAGVLAGYMVLFPRARVTTLVPLGFFLRVMELPALLLIGLWLAIQVVSGLLTLGWTGGGVAWWAHVGGFLTGALLVRLVTPRRVMA
ncbi:MAG TPA: rhomboid family intramembrane serine protease [Candidatus Eisenbacteria bacterium]|nr:rhomboid family intramembrane serine protease [Candidatus Eisenbacteria bacterium]